MCCCILRRQLAAASCGSGNVSLASYRPELVSVPDAVADCPAIESLLPPDARSFVEEYQERMLETAGIV